ncbi:hypothetical protein VNO77_04997 [Canavalia gladiata]|uniref:Uncharacterized protein n=1 Tax=Canavalia gladiata TaxID=3824 RepID=A0AAN9N2P2_CANGL
MVVGLDRFHLSGIGCVYSGNAETGFTRQDDEASPTLCISVVYIHDAAYSDTVTYWNSELIQRFPNRSNGTTIQYSHLVRVVVPYACLN